MAAHEPLPPRWPLAFGSLLSVVGLGYFFTWNPVWLLGFLALGFFYFLFEPHGTSGSHPSQPAMH